MIKNLSNIHKGFFTLPISISEIWDNDEDDKWNN
jgi:hypothetical protein